MSRSNAGSVQRISSVNPARLRERALELGFTAVGIAPVGLARHATSFSRWLAAGHHAGMAWLTRDPHRRLDPRQVVDRARSVIMVAVDYFVEDPPAEYWNDPMRGRIARYAWGPDYHEVLTPRLRQLADWLRTESSTDVVTRAYIDTGPLLERTWAAEAGLGFIGRNSLLIRPGYGSYCFLGGIITTLELPPDQPAEADGAVLGTGQCGQCSRCLQICPTHAFPAEYVVDSNRCISYLTIELKGPIPEPLRPLMQNWIYGCDACQQICPWVKRYSSPARDHFLSFDPDRFTPFLPDLVTWDDDTFRKNYRGTPLQRTKRRGILRNAAVALGNARDPAAIPALRQAASDPEPLIAQHAQWALESSPSLQTNA